MSLASNNALSNLRGLVIKNSVVNENTIYGANRHDKLTREELSRALVEKDNIIQNL